MERWQNRVAVVTGASSGIGEAIAKDFATTGLRVVALGRRLERLDENRSKLSADLQKRYFTRKCDVTNEAEVISTFEWIEKTLGGTDILVNNAGVSGRGGGNLVTMESDFMDKVLHTNVKGLVYCTKAAYKSMQARKFDGHIVHINSIAGHGIPNVTPGMSFNMYPPSKFCVTAINETIRCELRNLGTKIKTTSVSPGLVRTELSPKEFYDSVGIYLNPEDISQAVLYAVSTPPHVQIHEITVKPVGENF
ncbi:farnesol dehydrogenase-like isoform X1 [Episyrphus balteatus]|uniref:farnesol dehydrogenase-like isoform X1 n=1 Tax=Episyrphus balteatus TaxID=286459 RepID=UPI002485A9DC|nr:farnesol dehydrogenase-like isoform X1 [Episyrphus balteatus]